jgi:uncharacterized protein (DUF952 family)
MAMIYKILSRDVWPAAGDVVPWSDDDQRDGFMHLSTAAQVLETANRHFRGQRGLLALEIDEATLGPSLRYERSRGGALFPHFYGALPRAAVIRARALVEGVAGFEFAAGEEGA